MTCIVREIAKICFTIVRHGYAVPPPFTQGEHRAANGRPYIFYPSYVHKSDSIGMTCFFRLMIRGRKAVFSFGVTLKA